MATYTYDADAWTATAKDRARTALADTDVSGGADTALRSDEAITVAIAANGEPLGIALLAEGLINEFEQQPETISTGGQTFSWKKRGEGWRDLMVRLRAEAAAASGAGGAVVSLAPYRADSVVTESEYVRDIYWSG